MSHHEIGRFDDPTTAFGRRTLLRGAAATGLGLTAVAAATGTAYAATSQNGWPALKSGAIDLDPGSKRALQPGVLDGDVAVILNYVAGRFHEEVEPVYIPGSWGHNYRPITNGSAYSNHASGTAIDLNAPAHPYGASGTFSSGEQSAIRAILDDCNGVIRWGGDYSGTKDEMHFEINVGPSSSAVPELADRIRSEDRWVKHPTLKESAGGAAVTECQKLLNSKANAGLVEDGDYGPKTMAAVESYQDDQGLAVDGITGPKTWAALSGDS